MKVLLVHNHYGSAAPSGENRVFELEKKLLIENGHDVQTFEAYSDTLRSWGKLGNLAGALMTPWNPASAYKVYSRIKSFQPDVLHAHNTFPMLSPSIFSAAHHTARVLTLHNYRLFCPAAIPVRNNAPCSECINNQSVRPAMRHGCYRSSRLATAPLAANVALHRSRGTWKRDVEMFIALSKFQRDLMIRGGIPAERIMVKPNFYSGEAKQQPFMSRQDKVVFVGRLGQEKGICDLIAAWLRWGDLAPELRIIGDGELRNQLTRQTAHAPNIKFLGQVDNGAVEKEIGQAKLMVVPSRWFEGFPMVLIEAFANGTPVAVSNLGSLPEIASQADGILFQPHDPNDLLTKVRNCWNNVSRLEKMAKSSRKAYQKNYSGKKNLELLLDVYSKSISLKGDVT